MGKEDWTGIGYRRDPYCGRRGGSRSRSSSPEPIKRHIEWPPFYKGKICLNYRFVDITEEQTQEINKMKLKHNEEMKKAIGAAFEASEDGLTKEDVDKIKEEFAYSFDRSIKGVIGYHL
jgi:hypothetical protein